MSVRVRLSLVIVLLITILLGALYLGVRSTQTAAQDSSEINGVGLMRSRSREISALAGQIVVTDSNNQNALLILQTTLANSVGVNEAIIGLFRASDNVQRNEFSNLLANLGATNPEIVAAGYVPYVTAFSRADFEQSIRDEGFSDFQITEQNAEGEFVPTNQRGAYYPVNYLVPFELFVGLFGFDLGADSGRLAAIELARDTGQTVSAPPLSLGSQVIVLLFSPIYNNQAALETPQDRRANLRGFAVTAVDVGQLVNTAINFLAQGIAIQQVVDATDEASSPLPLYTASELATEDVTNLNVEIYGRNWVVTLQQAVNVADALQQFRASMDDLDTRVAALRNGSDELGFYGLDRQNDPAIDSTYGRLVNATGNLSDYVSTFLDTSSITTRAALVTQINLSSNEVFDESNRLVGLLEQGSEDRAAAISQISLFVALIAALTMGFGLFTVYQVIRNLSMINQSTQTIAQGNFDTRIDIKGRYELAQIGSSVNTMAEQLQTAFASLEERVAEATRNLQAIVDVGDQISAILDPTRLLQAVSNLTKERFGLYHAHIYLLNNENSGLSLVAGAGYVGRQMVASGQFIPINNPRSIVAKAARSRESVIVNNTIESSDFLPNRLLPDTRAELATPLVSRGQLLGVLDVQSDLTHYFDERILSTLEVLAGQIANALSNAQLYEEATRTSRHGKAITEISEAIQSATSMDEVLQAAIRELGKALRVPHTAIELQLNAPDGKNETL